MRSLTSQCQNSALCCFGENIARPLLRAKARRGVLVFFRADKVAASYVKKFCNGYKRIKVRFAPAHFPITDTVGRYVENERKFLLA